MRLETRTETAHDVPTFPIKKKKNAASNVSEAAQGIGFIENS